jgi:arylsulfatase A-like enzyme
VVSASGVGAVLLAALFVAPSCSTRDAAPSRVVARSNIVVILADDLGLGDPGCYNPASKVPMPALDRLASEGLRLTDAHSPSGVCTPTRYGILCGRYAWRTHLKSGVLWGESPNLIELERTTLAELLKDAGYRTACVGKWHLGLGGGRATNWEAPLRPGPLEHGFDEFFGIPASLDMDPYLFVENDRPVALPTETVAGSLPRVLDGEGFWRGGAAAPGFRHEDVLDALTERAVDFVRRAATGGEQPFFLYFPLTAPHTPWVPTEPFRGASGAGYYGDFVAQVDHTIGRVVASLEEHDVLDDTLLIVTSDNGADWPDGDIALWGHDANLGYRGQKADVWEGGHRVPFVARWPGHVPPGAVRDELVSLTDLYATLAAVAGARIPRRNGEDSIDQLAVLLGEPLEHPPRTEMIHHSMHGYFAVRRGPWKLIPFRGSGGFTKPVEHAPPEGEPPGQLYHLDDDPREQVNLYAERPAMVRALSALLAEERRVR